MSAQQKKRCLIHANCQGEQLAELLRAHPEFGRAYDVRHYVNYVREIIPREELSACDLFLYQRLDEKWGELASDALLPRLRPDARAICIPNFLFRGYWPFWSSAPGFDFSDSFLDALIERGLSNKEILHIHLFTDPGRYYDLEAIFRHSWDVERRKERDWDIKPLDLVEAQFRRERLFNTINHPGKRLCLFVADETLRVLGMAPLPEDVRDRFPEPYAEFVLPIHPAVAKFQGLGFAGPGETFNVFGKRMDYARYVSLYLECKRMGETDFTAFLRIVNGVGGETDSSGGR